MNCEPAVVITAGLTGTERTIEESKEFGDGNQSPDFGSGSDSGDDAQRDAVPDADFEVVPEVSGKPQEQP